jgi:hypothetical protein
LEDRNVVGKHALLLAPFHNGDADRGALDGDVFATSLRAVSPGTVTTGALVSSLVREMLTSGDLVWSRAVDSGPSFLSR